MTYRESVVRQTPDRPPNEVVSRTTTVRPSGGELARRWVVLIFGIIQILIALRIGLLLLDAREGNLLVRAILDGSQIFVLPFIGPFTTPDLRRATRAGGGGPAPPSTRARSVGWAPAGAPRSAGLRPRRAPRGGTAHSRATSGGASCTGPG